MRTCRTWPLALALAVVAAASPRAEEVRAYREPQDVVAWLYRDFAWEAVMSPRFAGDTFIDQPREVLERYFVEDLAALVLMDRECARRTKEICKLDFDPLFASNDPGASDLKVSWVAQSGLVHVTFKYPGNGQRIELDYKVVKSKRGWRVSDIIYKDRHTLRGLLSVPD